MTEKLQEIIYPQKDICEERDMYFRTNGIVKFHNNVIEIKNKTSISFDTYFNSFSVAKWRKYTVIDNVALHIKYKGTCSIILSHHSINNGQLTKQQMAEYQCNAIDEEEMLCNFLKLQDNGIYSFEIIANTDCYIYEMNYVTSTNYIINTLNIAIGFCTFKREKFILNNIRQLQENILNNQQSVLHNQLQIFIADNGQTLPNNINTEKIHLFWNKNYGGVGGFTRTIIEALFKSQNKFDYIILMDDDIVLDYRIIERTYLFLSFLKPQYKKNMIGGSMFAIEEKSKQIENGAVFKQKKINVLKKNLQLSNLKDVVENEIESILANYNGWFYCCIPTQIIHENNLPLPIFIHYDDIEYGVRNILPVITINGICVWHPTPDGKAPLWMTYYNERNRRILLLSLKNKYSIFEEILKILANFIICVSRYRYKDFYLYMKAVKDFYRGDSPFMKENPESLHKQLVNQYNYKWVNLTLNNPSFNNCGKKKTYFLGMLNYLTPALKKYRITQNGNTYYNCFMVKKIVVYDTFNNRAYNLIKSYRLLITSFISMIKTLFIVFTSYNRATKSWSKALPQLKSLKFWYTYLNLK
jgi:galactofuranosylgalactofuranosylrhamnosyl-N-acetylglucosaminyl-diphospho-decaprenol beta-1,5/1,6-galactofuranosyltransferase